MNKLKVLLQERADLVKEQKDIFALAEKEQRGLTDAEKGRDDAIAARMTDLNADITRLERQREFEKQVAQPAAHQPRIDSFHENIEDDPRRGFANLGEFAMAVKAHYTPGGKTDERLTIGAAPTNVHYETGSDEGRMVPPQFKQEIFEAVREGNDSLLAAVDSEPTASNAVEFLRDESTPWGATGVQAAWRSENVQMSASKLATGAELLRLHELYAFVLATGELIQDAPRLADRLTRKAGLAIRYKINEAIVNGTGAGQPLGWFTSAAKVTVTRSGANLIAATDVTKMFARAINPGASVWYANQDTIPQLYTMTLGQNALWFPPQAGIAGAPGGFLMGRPIVFLENCKSLGTTGDIQLVDPKGYYAAVKGSAPEYAESMHLFFDYNVNAYRWIFRLGGQPYLSAAITPAQGANTRANVVVLS